MKKIEAIIRKTKFEDVKEALLAADTTSNGFPITMSVVKARCARPESIVA